MKKFFTITFFSITLLSFVFTLAPIMTVFAAEYVPLSPLPDLGAGKPIAGNFSDYLTGIYKLAIGIAGVLAVIVILFEGIKHMASESFVAKADTSARIGAAIGGLLLAIGAWVILNAINPKLVTFNLVLETVPSATLDAPPSIGLLLTQNEAALRVARDKIAVADKVVDTARIALQTATETFVAECLATNAGFSVVDCEYLATQDTTIQALKDAADKAVADRKIIADNATAVVKIQKTVTDLKTIIESLQVSFANLLGHIGPTKFNTAVSQMIETRVSAQKLIDQQKTVPDPTGEVATAVSKTVTDFNAAVDKECITLQKYKSTPCGVYSCDLINSLCNGSLTK